jgi:hypothetical protein
MDKDNRLMLWIAKFAYPEINTKKTKIYLIPSISNSVWISTNKRLDVRKYAYSSRHHLLFISIAYDAETDFLIVKSGSFHHERLREFPDLRKPRKMDLLDVALYYFDKDGKRI